jgi:hypothetical protein
MNHSLLHAVLACVLYDPPYRDRFHTLPCVKKICNEILAPDGMVLGKNTLKNAFKITGGGFYTEYFMDGLISDIGCPEGTIMAVRRVRRTNAEEGFFTCVGCFNKSSVPSEEDTRRLDVGGDIVPRISTRGGLVNEIPHQIHGNFLTGYAKNAKKNYFVAKSAYSPTPVKRPRPVPSRPGTASSQSSTKRGRQTPEQPTSPPGQSDNEKRRLLREKLDRQIPQQKALEQKIAEKVKGLKSLHSHIKNANNLHASIEESVAELAVLGEEYFVDADDIPNNTMMNYCFGREKLVVLDVFWDHGVLFTSELLDGIVEEVQLDL